jgi:DNA-binding YbaB/EbfC family protein
MKNGLENMLKQAEKIQKELACLQEELAKRHVTGEAGGGMVKITMNGKRDVVAVNIESLAITEDKSMLEDLVAAAVNDATRRVEQLSSKKMADITAGIELPAGIKSPF